jgi:hypothetical protein
MGPSFFCQKFGRWYRIGPDVLLKTAAKPGFLQKDVADAIE